jgi:bacterioferritin (cytochrome b1)
MKNEILKMPASANRVDTLTDALVNVMKYSDSSVDYPNIDGAKPDNGVIAEWFYPIYNGTNDFSELTAIHMYTSQEAEFDEIGELMLGIGLTEMKHYAKLADFIRQLGGKIDQRYDNSGVAIGETPREALSIAYNAEVKTIDFYQRLTEKIQKVKQTKTTVIALQLISKLIADEEFHQRLLKQAITEFSKKEQALRDKLEEIE